MPAIFLVYLPGLAQHHSARPSIGVQSSWKEPNISLEIMCGTRTARTAYR